MSHKQSTALHTSPSPLSQEDRHILATGCITNSAKQWTEPPATGASRTYTHVSHCTPGHSLGPLFVLALLIKSDHLSCYYEFTGTTHTRARRGPSLHFPNTVKLALTPRHCWLWGKGRNLPRARLHRGRAPCGGCGTRDPTVITGKLIYYYYFFSPRCQRKPIPADCQVFVLFLRFLFVCLWFFSMPASAAGEGSIAPQPREIPHGRPGPASPPGSPGPWGSLLHFWGLHWAARRASSHVWRGMGRAAQTAGTKRGRQRAPGSGPRWAAAAPRQRVRGQPRPHPSHRMSSCLPSPGAAAILWEAIHLFRRQPAGAPRQIIAGIKIK